MEVLEARLQYKFNNVKLLENALNHSSYANEVRNGTKSNERLEFLGDSVLSVIVASYLFENFKTIPEGELTKLRASLVCEKSLCGFSRELGIGECLKLGKGEEKGGGRERDMFQGRNRHEEIFGNDHGSSDDSIPRGLRRQLCSHDGSSGS